MCGDGFAQEDEVVWCRGASMAEWPDKVEASIFALKTDLWKVAATTHECVEPVCTLDPVCGSAGASSF